MGYELMGYAFVTMCNNPFVTTSPAGGRVMVLAHLTIGA